MDYCSFESDGKKSRLRTAKGLVVTAARAGLRSAKSKAICSKAREAFESSGWVFVRDKKSLPPSQKCSVLIPKDGPVCVGTHRLVARFSGKARKAELYELFRSVDVHVLHQSPTRRNLFELRVQRDRNLGTIAQSILEHPYCQYCIPDVLEIIEQRAVPTDPRFGDQWQWDRIDAALAWDVTTGIIAATPTQVSKPVRIGIIDWGFERRHPDLASAVSRTGFFQEVLLGGRAHFFPDPGMLPVNDHGTFCAGMAGARHNNNNGGCGIAPDSQLTLVSCLNNGVGSQVSLARAIEYAVDPTIEDPTSTDGGVDVLSCSIAPAVINQLNPRLKDAIEFATSRGRGGKGVPLFYAVPNQSISASSDAICAHDSVIGVGNSNRNDNPHMSARGTGLEFLAPGRGVFSTAGRSAFRSKTGTSFATPVAAGGAALVIANRPDFSWPQVRAKLRESCDGEVTHVSFGPDGRNRSHGFGRINAAKALGLAPVH